MIKLLNAEKEKMKYLTILVLSLTFLTSVRAEVAIYCAQDQILKIPRTYEAILTGNEKCDVRTPLFFYQNWKEKYPLAERMDYKSQETLISPNPTEVQMFIIYQEIELQKTVHSDYKNCKYEMIGFASIMTCDNGIKMNIDDEVKKKALTEEQNKQIASEYIYAQGKIQFDAIVPVKNDTTEKKVETVSGPLVTSTESNKAEETVVTIPKTTESIILATDVEIVAPIAKVEDEKQETAPDCKEELNKEMAKLLAHDTKNIIGLQYELTVLKMASITLKAESKTLEGLIKKQSKEIAAIDTGIIERMNSMYKTHGLKEDATSITNILKEKSTSPNYYDRHKRFFNQESSAFVMAYKQMNPSSSIIDSDISVLWFMDKVSEKAKSQTKAFSEMHNLTNLSTRIAQYTGAINPKKALTKPAVDEMIEKQKKKINNEFLALIESFKKNNPVCFNSLFGEGDSECNLTQVQESFSHLLAINSKIPSTDLIYLGGKISGAIDKARFSISKYVDAPEK